MCFVLRSSQLLIWLSFLIKDFYHFCVNSRFSKHHWQGILLNFGRSVEAHSINPLKQLRLSAMKDKNILWRFLLFMSNLSYRGNWHSIQVLTDAALQMILQSTKESWDLVEELQLGWWYSQDCSGLVYSVMTELPCPLRENITKYTLFFDNTELLTSNSRIITTGTVSNS